MDPDFGGKMSDAYITPSQKKTGLYTGDLIRDLFDLLVGGHLTIPKKAPGIDLKFPESHSRSSPKPE